MICIFKHTKYGFSGNEIPPAPISTETYIEMSNSDEAEDAFRKRMSNIGMALRQLIKKNPVAAYSISDGLDWTIYKEAPVSTLIEKLY